MCQDEKRAGKPALFLTDQTIYRPLRQRQARKPGLEMLLLGQICRLNGIVSALDLHFSKRLLLPNPELIKPNQL